MISVLQDFEVDSMGGLIKAPVGLDPDALDAWREAGEWLVGDDGSRLSEFDIAGVEFGDFENASRFVDKYAEEKEENEEGKEEPEPEPEPERETEV